jgi:hypothetical protein
VNAEDRLLTVTRAVEGTTAKSHNAGDLAIAVLTDGGLNQMLADRVLFGNTRPRYGNLSDSSGNRVKVADLTWDNQGSATATDVNGTIWMDGKRAASNDVHSLLMGVPATPWTFTLGWRPLITHIITNDDGFPQAGLVLKNSGSARLIMFNVYNRHGAGEADNGNQKTAIEYMTSATLFSSTPFGPTGIQHRYDDMIWHRVTDDGTTNLTFDVSRDGINWTNLATLGRTAWLTSGPDRVGFCIEPSSADAAGGSDFDNFAVFAHTSFS